MQTFWLKFTDGTEASCQGANAYDARRIAEHLSGKTIDGPKYEGGPNVVTLPYPADPCLWKFDHPCHGKAPSFCHAPRQCKGRTACPQNYSCTE
jgi:hypothetical protein